MESPGRTFALTLVAALIAGLAACGGGGPAPTPASADAGAVDTAADAVDPVDLAAEAPEDGARDADPQPGSDAAADAAPAVPLGTTCTPAALADLFVDRVPPHAWIDRELGPEAGMAGVAGLLAELASSLPEVPVRVRLRPGLYAAAEGDAPAVLEVVGLVRSAEAPVLVIAADPAPGATRLAQGLRLVGAAFVAFDGVSIGPPEVGRFHGSDFCVGMSCHHEEPKPLAAPAGLHVAGTAIAPTSAGSRAGKLDHAVYGRYAPARDIVLRRITVQNVFGDDEPSGVAAADATPGGILVSHAENVVVDAALVRQTAGAAIALVGVHGACVRGSTLVETGGVAFTARAGSTDVTFDGNVAVDVRRVDLGGRDSDAVEHWSHEPVGTPLHLGYEGRRIVARNNLLVNPREGGFRFRGCQDCAAVSNTLFYRVDFDLGRGGGDAVREADAAINRDEASAACRARDGAVVDPCWQVGAYPAELVPVPGRDGESRALRNARNVFGNNLLLNAAGAWGSELAPYQHAGAGHSRGFGLVDHNVYWNGAVPLADPGDDTWLPEGAHSRFAAAHELPIADADFVLGPDARGLRDAALAALTPSAGASVIGRGGVLPGHAEHDARGRPRPASPTTGALEP